MNESFLHYLWQFQYFDKRNLLTTEAEELSIMKSGVVNSDSGPDFFNAKLKISGIEWAGNVEIHLKSSDWFAHHHQKDQAYNNVVLHVVWEHDKPVYRDGAIIPTLELKNRVDPSLIHEFKKLIHSSALIACQKAFPKVEDIIKMSMLDKALMQRLETKAYQVAEVFRKNNNDWEETTYQLLAKNFGFKINSDSFLQLGRSLNYKIIQKQNSLLQVEALLFGQAGMLQTKTKDEYISLLFREYQLLIQKYGLKGSSMSPARWKFLRLRPANFPTVRIAQLAAVLFSTRNIFSKCISAESYAAVIDLFTHGQSDYWREHYRFGAKAKRPVSELGESSIQNIAINTIAPLLVAYGKYKDEQVYIDRAIEILQRIPAEFNKITRAWESIGLSVKNSFDSQALIELHNNFCQRRLCLNCNIGVSILKPRS